MEIDFFSLFLGICIGILAALIISLSVSIKDKPGNNMTFRKPNDNREDPFQRSETKIKAAHINHDIDTPEKMKISIKRQTDYKLKQISKELPLKDKKINRHGKSYFMIITESANERLKSFIDWGEKTKRNTVEQGGILLGNAYQYENEIYNIVQDVLLADTHGNPVFVEFTHNMWHKLNDDLSRLNSRLSEDEQLNIVGWYHTHPNSLDVFMSGTDMRTQRISFCLDWQLSMVINPHRKKLCVFFGKNAIEGQKYILDDQYMDELRSIILKN